MAHTPWLLELEDNGQVHKHLPQPSVSAPLLYEGRDANRDVCRLKEKNGEPGKLREESVSRRKDPTGAAPER